MIAGNDLAARAFPAQHCPQTLVGFHLFVVCQVTGNDDVIDVLAMVRDGKIAQLREATIKDAKESE